MVRGMCFGLDDATAESLLAAADDAALDERVADIEDRMWDAGLVLACELDKAWDPISCALCPNAYAGIGPDQDWWSDPATWPARGAILGHRVLNDDLETALLTYNDPAQVAEVAAFLETIDHDRFLALYRAMPSDLRNPEYGTSEGDYAWGWLAELTRFYTQAAADSRHVIFSVAF
ncbi:DUF1877 family protein [Nocardioides sp.]|uniref:DUF1877 family protein n=1 Tax=Nocardioides sp. TaxID=35761 RepID=UPI00260BAA4E|nr:DUF1877 family protein [Nocardioides sp.]